MGSRSAALRGLAGFWSVLALLGCSPAPDNPLPATATASHTAPDYCRSAPADALPCVAASDALQVRIVNAAIRLAPGIVVHADTLDATLIPDSHDAPVVLDALTQFKVVVHTGTVRLDTQALAALVEHRFNERDGAVRRLSLSRDGDHIRIRGEFRRRGWVPFDLTGTLARKDATHLVLKPVHLIVDGHSASALMQAAHLELADIIHLDTPAFTIRGNRILIDVPALLPAPRIMLQIADARLAPDGLRLVLDDATTPSPVRPARPADAFILLHGGRLAIGPLHTDDPRIQLVARDTASNAALELSLARYRRQLAAGHITLLPGPERATFVAALGALGGAPEATP